MGTCVTLAPGVRFWTYFDNYVGLVYDLSDDNPGLHVKISRDKGDPEEHITVKVVNPERLDDSGGGIFTLAEFPNTDEGWSAAQAYVLKMLDTFGWTELKGTIKARIDARLALASPITPEPAQ